MNDLTLLTVEQIAGMLSVCELTVYKLIKEGKLKHCKIGNRKRVSMSDLMAFINSCKVA
jgi:excisionase family DNA binding protein